MQAVRQETRKHVARKKIGIVPYQLGKQKQGKHVKTLPLDPDRQGEAGDDSSAFSSCLFATRVERPRNQKESY
jgi:hypothetical protein